MPAENPKGQHFVHRAYLEGFQDTGLPGRTRRALWVYIPGKQPFSQGPDRVARRNYYYCYRREEERQFQIEHGLQKLEDLALPILVRLREGDLTCNQDERLTFSGYIALSYTRVPTFERIVNNLAALVDAKRIEFIASHRPALEAVVAKMRAKTGENIDVDDFHRKLTGGSAYVDQVDRSWSIKQMLETMMALQKLIFTMSWSFLKAPADDDGFLTSDNPVSLFDPIAGGMGTIGFASSPAAHFTFPIGKGICLLAGHQPNTHSIQLTASDVRETNKGTIPRADGQLYAPFKSRGVQELFDYVAKQKKPYRRILMKHGRVVEE